MGHSDEGHGPPFFKRGLDAFKKDGIPFRQDRLAAGGKLSCHGVELLYISFEESLLEDFFVDSPVLNSD